MSYLFERVSVSSLASSVKETPLADYFRDEEASCTSGCAVVVTEQMNTSEISNDNYQQQQQLFTQGKQNDDAFKDLSYPTSWGSSSSSCGFSDLPCCSSSPSLESGGERNCKERNRRKSEAILEERKNEERRLQQRVQKLVEMFGRENSLAAFRADHVLSRHPIYLDKSACTRVNMYRSREKSCVHLSSLSPEQIRNRRNKQKRESKQRCRQYKRDQQIAVENNIHLIERASLLLYHFIDQRLQNFDPETHTNT